MKPIQLHSDWDRSDLYAEYIAFGVLAGIRGARFKPESMGAIQLRYALEPFSFAAEDLRVRGWGR